MTKKELEGVLDNAKSDIDHLLYLLEKVYVDRDFHVFQSIKETLRDFNIIVE